MTAMLDLYCHAPPSIEPTTQEQRTDERIYQIFFVWFSANVNIQSCVPPSIHDGPFIH